MNHQDLSRWNGRSVLAATLLSIPAVSFGAPILGGHIINDTVSLGSGDLLQIQTNPGVATANLIVGWGAGNSGTLDVQSGGQVEIDGTPDASAAGVFPGMSIARQSGSTGSVRVDGAGSKITVKGNTGFLNVAGSSTSDNGTASLEVTNGARISGDGGVSDFVNLNVGGGVGTSGVGTVLVSGTGSQLALAGTFGPGSADEGGGPVLNIGRGSGSGTVTVNDGGVLSLNATGVAPTLFGPFINVGRNPGSTGQLNITGPGSQVVMTSDSLSPSVMIGRGGVGGLTVTNGAMLQMNGYGLSTSTVFNNNQLRVGGDGNTFVGTGTVTVSGSGSRIELNGSADRYVFLGSGSGSTGTLNIQNEGHVESLYMIVGLLGGTGTLTMNNGSLHLEGVGSGPISDGLGAGIGVGRGMGSLGTVSVVNGSSITIDGTGVRGGIAIGGSSTAAGGTGIMNVLGGSSVTVGGSAPGSGIYIGANAGSGTLTVGGIGTIVDVSGVDDGGRVMVGSNTGAVGSLTVSDSASVNAGHLLGVAHDGANDTGGIGTVMIGSDASVKAPDIHLGSMGVIGGVGTLVGNVTNHGGLISPGLSPGELTIVGDYSGSGQFLLEIFDTGTGFVIDSVRFSKAGANLDFSDSLVEFLFVGATNPLHFLSSELNSFSSFFKFEDDADIRLYSTQFAARADDYRIDSFVFSLDSGFTGFEVARVPEPGTLLLILSGLAGLALCGRRSALPRKETPAFRAVA